MKSQPLVVTCFSCGEEVFPPKPRTCGDKTCYGLVINQATFPLCQQCLAKIPPAKRKMTGSVQASCAVYLGYLSESQPTGFILVSRVFFLTYQAVIRHLCGQKAKAPKRH